MNAQALKRAVDLANSLREKMPGEQLLLADLPPGRPRNPGQCLLARAFNFDCVVDASGGNGVWEAQFLAISKERKQLLEQWAKEEHLSTVVFDPFPGWKSPNDWGIAITLPPAVGELASLFDSDKLPDQYYETHYDDEYYPDPNKEE